MTVFVHLGAHKTGSTLLQNVLRNNRKRLLKQGVFYQRGPGRHPFWHFHQTGDLEDFQSRCEEMRAAFIENAQNNRHVIFSSETVFGSSDLAGNKRLYPQAPWALKALRDILEGLEVKIIFYVRRQDDFIESTFINRIQTLATSPNLDHVACLSDRTWGSFPAYLSSFDPANLSWLQLAEEMAAYFGARNLIIRPFETIRRGRADYSSTFLEDFCDPVRLDTAPEVYENRSFSQHAIDAFLAQAPQTPYEGLKALRLSLQERYPSPQYPRPRLLTLKQRAQILEVTEADNRALFARYVDDPDQMFAYDGM